MLSLPVENKWKDGCARKHGTAELALPSLAKVWMLGLERRGRFQMSRSNKNGWECEQLGCNVTN